MHPGDLGGRREARGCGLWMSENQFFAHITPMFPCRISLVTQSAGSPSAQAGHRPSPLGVYVEQGLLRVWVSGFSGPRAASALLLPRLPSDPARPLQPGPSPWASDRNRL